ncbi:hypothetical protein GQ457_03G029200 [Hibiscus cannabinus]
MSSLRNPSVEIALTDEGIVAGYQDGRPPDGVMVANGSSLLDRQASPVAPDAQPVLKKGRTMAEGMVIDDDTSAGERVADSLERPDQSPPVLEKDQSPPLLSSFKDKLLGAVSRKPSTLTDLDVEVKAEDVQIGGNGTLPEIRFSDTVHNEVDVQLASSVIIRLLGKSIGYRALLNRVQSLWNPSGDMCLVDLDNDYYLARFALAEDFQKVLTGGPWVIYGSYLTVQPWNRNFSTTEAHPSHTMVWMRLPKLQYMYYTKSLFRHIAAAIGKVVKVDYNTEEGKRGRFARLAIIVDLHKPLVSGIIIDGYRQDVEYEGLPNICFKCGKFGHSKEQCSGDRLVEGDKGEAPLQRNPSELYGPWMQVANRRRRPGVINRRTDRTVGAEPSRATRGSRFATLEENGLDANEVSEEVQIRTVAAGMEVEVGCNDLVGGYDDRPVQAAHPSAPLAAGPEPRRILSHGEPSATTTTLVQSSDVHIADKSEAIHGRVASKDKVVPVPTSLATSKHSVIQVIPDGESIEPRKSNGRVLPASIRGIAQKGGTKKGAGSSGVTKLGVKQKKREDRGQAKHGLQSCLANLVSDLDRAIEAERARELATNNQGVNDTAPTKWTTNSVFEHPGESDMQGALDPAFERSFRLLLQNQVPDIVAIFEPRISGQAADTFVRRFEFEHSYRVEARGFSGGIWIMWRGSVQVDVLAVSNQFVHGWCVPLNGERGFFITFVYASPNAGRRRELWDQLRVLDPGDDSPWVVGGDLNVIGNSAERRGGSDRRLGVCPRFCEFMNESGLIDMGFSGACFTWSRGNLSQRLDRCLCNVAWYNFFASSEVHHLLRLGSDHRPILLKSTSEHSERERRPFRYIVAWNDHEDFHRMLATNWSPDKPFSENVSQFQDASRKWNREVFGHIEIRKRHILARLKGIEQALDLEANPYLEELEKALKKDLDIVLSQEESLWHQKARGNWIAKGDRNTRFFHLAAISRRKRNTIQSLIIDGHWGDSFRHPPVEMLALLEADKQQGKGRISGS